MRCGPGHGAPAGWVGCWMSRRGSDRGWVGAAVGVLLGVMANLSLVLCGLLLFASQLVPNAFRAGPTSASAFPRSLRLRGR